MGYKQIPSQANFIMFDVKRPVVPMIKALKERNVQVGRLFPALPNHMRLTIGKKTEMEAFLVNLPSSNGLMASCACHAARTQLAVAFQKQLSEGGHRFAK